MLGPIWSIIELYLREVFKRQLQISEKRNFWKRSAIGKFMALHESLLDLELASFHLYDLFIELSDDDAVLVKIIVKARLTSLSKSFEKFINAYREIEKLLSIYDDSLRLHLVEVITMKEKFWANVELWDKALPVNKDAEGRLSSTISYFSFVPTKEMVHNLVQPVEVEEEFFEGKKAKAATEKMKTELISKIAIEEVDLNDKGQIKQILEPAKKICEDLGIARNELAEFIKNNFPLDKIMMQ